ncbi:MAG: class I SAM-dependent methyltransferase [Anaerolineales bacterium]|jgi:SAM-dependent methyltransferase
MGRQSLIVKLKKMIKTALFRYLKGRLSTNIELKSTLEIISPSKIKKSNFYRVLKFANIKGGWNYDLDHTWLFENIYGFLELKANKIDTIILDIGCGMSKFHVFLERYFNIGIIGIDRIDGLCPMIHRNKIVDLNIDFCSQNDFFNNQVDIIFWCSAIEHNSIDLQIACVEESLKALKPGGLFLATFALSEATHYFEPSQQWNLSRVDAEKVFKTPWKSEFDYEAYIAEYEANILGLKRKYKKRYKTSQFSFLVAGAKIVKPE